MIKFAHKYSENVIKAIRDRYFAILIGFLCLFALPLPGLADIRFEEVTTAAGISRVGESWGASWTDYDGDGWPDLWATNHIAFPSLYRNNHNGTFTNIARQVWPGLATDDTHGSAWADFDNDGDIDFYQTIGAQQGLGSGPKQLWVNEGGVFIDRAAELGVDYPLGRGRTALWFDLNGDGRLDIALGNQKRPDGQAPPVLFQQTADGTFENVSTNVGFDVTNSADYMQLSDLNLDGKPEFVVHGVAYPQRIYDLGQRPFVDLTPNLGLSETTSDVWDSAIADFNGDLRPDIFLSRIKDLRGVSDVTQESSNNTKCY